MASERQTQPDDPSPPEVFGTDPMHSSTTLAGKDPLSNLPGPSGQLPIPSPSVTPAGSGNNVPPQIVFESESACRGWAAARGRYECALALKGDAAQARSAVWSMTTSAGSGSTYRIHPTTGVVTGVAPETAGTVKLEITATFASGAESKFVRDIQVFGSGIVPMTPVNLDYRSFGFHEHQGSFFFSGFRAEQGEEPWKVAVDKPSSGELIKEINPTTNPQSGTPLGSVPSQFTSFRGRVFFAASDGSSGRELWTSDGTPSGTQRVADINIGPAGSSPSEFIEMGGFLYFKASTAQHGSNVWRTDGTADGTRLVADLVPGPAGTFVNDTGMAVLNNKLYFTGTNAETNQHILYESDGTSVGTKQVVTLPPMPRGLVVYPELKKVGSLLYFSNVGKVGESQSVREVWSSDGTAQGTRILKDPAGRTISGMGSSTSLKGAQYFLGEAEGTGYRELLWRLAPDGRSAEAIASPTPLLNGHGRATYVHRDVMYFLGGPVEREGSSNMTTVSLFSYTGVGTPQKILDVSQTLRGYINLLTPYRGSMIIASESADSGKEYWEITLSQTPSLRRIADLAPGSLSSASGLPFATVINDALFFLADTDGAFVGTARSQIFRYIP